MPQPVSNVAPGVALTIGSASAIEAFRRYPKLATLVAQAIATWTVVEYSMMDLFIDLAGGPKEKAGAIYLSLEIQSAKTAAISALIRDCSEQHKELYYCLNDLRKTRQRQRDKLAHWVWGYSHEINDSLLLSNPRDLISIFHPLKTFSGGLPEMFELRNSLEEKIYVYTERDLSEIIQSNRRLYGYRQKFAEIISFPPLPNSAVYDSLLAEPDIADTARRRAKRDQTPPKGGP
jgi:hypothetical protein